MIKLFRVFIPASILGLLLSEIFLTTAIYLGAILWQFEEVYIYLQLEDAWSQLPVVIITLIGGLYLNDCYERVRMQSRIIFIQQLCLVIGVAFLAQALLSYAKVSIRMPRQAMLLGSFLCLVLLPLWRSIYSKLALQLLGAEKVLFAGTHPLQFKLYDYLQERPEYAMEPVGFVVESDKPLEGYRSLGRLVDLEPVVKKEKPDRIIVGLADSTDKTAVQKVFDLIHMGGRVESLDRIYESVMCRVALSQLSPNQAFPSGGLRPSPLLLSLQTAYSWVIALVGLVLVSPILLAAAIAVRVSSPGPVLFRQTRAGENGAPFLLYKFRSMYVDAEKHTGAVWASENDPRVTAVGRFLRQYRIDELPQLFNVLKGNMAIVGPRPERPEFVKMLADQIPFYMNRLSVKPGITGWAQINYRYGNTVEDTVVKLEYDLYYIKNLSPQLDFYVMFHTVKTMLLTRGAY